MAALNVWSAATWAMLPPFLAAIGLTLRGTVAQRLVALQLATGVTILLLGLMSFAFQQDSYIDLALTLALLNIPGSLAMAVAIERWL